MLLYYVCYSDEIAYVNQMYSTFDYFFKLMYAWDDFL